MATATAVEPCPVAYWAVAPTRAVETELVIGEKVTVRIGDEAEAKELIFAGRLVEIEGSSASALFYDPAKDELHVVPWRSVKWKNGEGNEVTLSRAAPVILPLATANDTEKANALTQAFLQVQHRSRGTRFDALDNEMKVLRLFARLFESLHRTGDGAAKYSLSTALNVQAVGLGLSVKKLSAEPRKLAEQIEARVRGGDPVVLDFVPKLDVNLPIIVQPGKEPQAGVGYVPEKEQPYRGFFARLIRGKLPETTRFQVVVLAVLDGPKGKRFLVVDPNNGMTPLLWDEKFIREVEGKGMDAWAIRVPATKGAK